MNILIVDDEEAFSDIGRLILERAGFTVWNAPSATEAMPFVEKSPPDLILSDVEMPGMDGFEFLRRLRAHPTLNGIPFILMSARRTYPTDRVAGLNLGSDDYVSKPFSGDELVSRVKAVLRRSGRSDVPTLPAGLAAGGGSQVTDAEFIAALDKAPPPATFKRPPLPDSVAALPSGGAAAVPAPAPASAPAPAPLTATAGQLLSSTHPTLIDLARRAASEQVFSALFVNLSFFRGYNECYGFNRGDEVLRRTLAILEAAARHDPRGAAAHLGADDFLLLTDPSKVAALCHAIVVEFDRQVPSFYSEEDRERGFVEGRSRLRKAVAYPFMNVVIGVATSQRKGMTHIGQFFQVGRELLRYAKSLGGSRFLLDRRKDPPAGS
jgi:CheY-like chemotaxis protein